MKKLGNIYSFIFFFALVIIDQLSKYLIRPYDGFYICNSGISFGLKIPSIIFWMLWIIIIIFLVFLLLKKIFNPKIFNDQSSMINKCSMFNDQWLIFSLIFILSGASGNIIDRLFFGCVLDFIDLRIWPVFNLADTFITLGAAGIMISLLRNKK